MSAADLLRVQERAHRVAAQVERLHAAMARLEREVGLAKGRLALKDAAASVLETVRDRIHQRTVGSYETLLSRLLQETLPEQSADARIKVDLSTRRGASSIEFLLERVSTGHTESVYNGNGGALTNILSAGLRLIALYKSRLILRPFLVLDEPDCWLAPERVGDFYRVLSVAARDLGIQMLVITHHDSERLEQADAHFVRLLAASPGLSVDADPVHWDAQQEGIRSLRLVNYRSHRDSFIPLSPGVTVLSGANNLGKSAVVDALRAAAYGEGSDEAIAHNQPSCRLEIDLGTSRLVWQRLRKGNPKEKYAQCAPDGAVLREEYRSRGEVPGWFADALRIRLIDGLDVQIGHQKHPVFLLDEPATRQAALLSAGKEAAWIDRLLAAHRAMVTEDNTTVRTGEQRLAALGAVAKRLPDPQTLAEASRRLAKAWESIVEERQTIQEGLALLQNMTLVHQAAHCATPPAIAPTPVLHDTAEARRLIQGLQEMKKTGVALAVAVQAGVPSPPHLSDTGQMGALIEDLRRSRRLALWPALPVVAQVPICEDVDNARATLEDLRRYRAMAQMRTPPAAPVAPDIADDAVLRSVVQDLLQARRDGLRTKEDLSICLKDLAQAQIDIEAAQEAAGGMCPACGRAFAKGATHAHA